MVRDRVAVADGVAEDALPAGRVDVVVRAEDERARGRGERVREQLAGLAEERPARVVAAPDANFVLIARVRVARRLRDL